jgi:hypothetical protein
MVLTMLNFHIIIQSFLELLQIYCREGRCKDTTRGAPKRDTPSDFNTNLTIHQTLPER